jgi:hypothetical protein
VGLVNVRGVIKATFKEKQDTRMITIKKRLMGIIF